MGSRYELEVTVTKAKDLKNVNWRHGPLKPYAVIWIDPKAKCSTRVDENGDTSPEWNETLVIPFDTPIEESALYVDIVHSGGEEGTKPLIGSARLFLRDVVDEVGFGRSAERKLELKRPSGRPQGKLVVTVNVREPRYRAPEPYYAPPYGVPPPGSRDYPAPPPPYGASYAAPPPPYGASYAAPPPSGYAATPSGYPYSGPPPPPYGQPAYGQPAYGTSQVVYEGEKKKSKFGGMGTGLAVGAVAGALGGLALAEGIDHVEDEIAEEAAEKVEDDLGYDDAGDW